LLAASSTATSIALALAPIGHDGSMRVVLVRHGETAWSRAGRHTGRTDLPLLDEGVRQAEAVGVRLRAFTFAQVWCSPLTRARETCRHAGLGDHAIYEPDLMEWDYGDYEGRRTVDIRQERPDWDLFRDGCPGGESVAAIGARADRVIARLRAVDGHVLLFSHGHFLRVLAARWLGLPADKARLFVLSTAALSILGYEHTLAEPAIRLWNDDRHVVEEDREPVEKRGNR
jgi:broad specificity phosphatase PhoE